MRDGDDGMTVVEVALAGALSLVLLAGFGAAIFTGLRTVGFGTNQSQTLDSSRLVLNQVQRDLQGSQGYADCSSGAGTCVEITVQPPGGGSQKVRYRLDGSTLFREIDDGTGTYPGSQAVSTKLANGGTPLFSCTILGQLLQIGVNMVVQPDASRTATFNLQTIVRPRNTYAAIC